MQRSSVSLPKGWSKHAKSALLQVIALARYATIEAWSRGTTGTSAQQRAAAEIALLREEIRIKDARLALIAPHRRPHYPPVQRLAILELRTARGWSFEQTARAFQISAQTVAKWLRRIDEQGPEALMQLSQPVNKFPLFVGYVVRRLKTLCPTLGKRKLAALLARAGLHLGVTTVGRMLQQSPTPATGGDGGEGAADSMPRVVTAKHPNHVWHVDLTVAPINSGFWVPWSPHSLLQCWPFCWWLAVVVDHYSRRIVGFTTYAKQPTSEQIRAFLARTMQQARAKPKHIICDRGGQFDNDRFRAWCKRHRIKPRYGAIGRQGSIAVVERCILTIKLLLAALPLIPLRREALRREVALLVDWYNEHRPHETLRCATPNEVYFRRFPAHRKPRYEPRSRWPRGSPCARPWALVRGSLGARLQLDVAFLGGRRHLPIVRLQRVA